MGVWDTAIQHLNTVTYMDERVMGGSAFEEGDFNWTSIFAVGTYVLGYQDGTNPWKLSEVLHFRPDGRWARGVAPPDMEFRYFTEGSGNNDNNAIPDETTWVRMPTGYSVVAFWQPGAFPFPRGDYQGSTEFPGFAWMADTFPTGALGLFGYPFADTRAWVVPDAVGKHGLPGGQFWDWPSGFRVNDSYGTFLRVLRIWGYFDPVDDQWADVQLWLNGHPLPAVTTQASFDFRTWTGAMLPEGQAPDQSAAGTHVRRNMWNFARWERTNVLAWTYNQGLGRRTVDVNVQKFFLDPNSLTFPGTWSLTTLGSYGILLSAAEQGTFSGSIIFEMQ